MVKWQGRSKRKYTGAKYHHGRKKRKRELGRAAGETQIGSPRKKFIRTRGSNKKIRLLQYSHACVVDKEGNSKKVRILDVEDNPANKDFARRKIITKGATIETEIGLARVTSRPGQHGVINAVLVTEEM
ncbi:MAG: 30S ribosomal protein S8e [Promethearchaeota archaeon]